MEIHILNYLSIIFRALIFLLGFSLFYMSYFLYENEENVFQDMLANLWFKIDNYVTYLNSPDQPLIYRVFNSLELFLNKLHGNKIFSLDALISSTTFVYLPIVILSLIEMVKLKYDNSYSQNYWFFLYYLPIMILMQYFLLKIEERKFIKILSIFILGFLLYKSTSEVLSSSEDGKAYRIVFYIFPVFTAFAGVVITRYWIKNIKIISIIKSILLIIIIPIIFATPIIYSVGYFLIIPNDQEISKYLSALYIYATIYLFSSSLYIPLYIAVALAINAIDLILLKSFQRSIYSIHRFRLIFEHRKTSMTLGIVLMLWSIYHDQNLINMYNKM